MLDEPKVKAGEFDLSALAGTPKGANTNDWAVVGFVPAGTVNTPLSEPDAVLPAIPADDVPNAKGEPLELEFSILVTPSLSKNLNGKLLEAVCSVCTSLSPNSTCDSVAPVSIVFRPSFPSAKLKGKLFDVPSDVPRALFAAVNAVPVLTFLTVNGPSGEGFPCKPIGETNWKPDLEASGETDAFPSDNLAAPQAMHTHVRSSLEIQHTEHDQQPGFGANLVMKSEILFADCAVLCTLEVSFFGKFWQCSNFSLNNRNSSWVLNLTANCSGFPISSE